VIIGEGHSPEHVCLFNQTEKILIAGDQILARISPNISVWPAEPEANPLAKFLASFERLKKLPRSTLVLPSHGIPFYGLHARIDELEKHHSERLAQALDFCQTPSTVKDVLPVLFGQTLAPDQIPFGVGETLAHLNYLVGSGKLKRELQEGVWRFIRA
jgi:glyoxylase-like metal-dependent hydrolase (beta-lactamase superfamily II)